LFGRDELLFLNARGFPLGEDFGASAQRHRRDAHFLAANDRFQNAGHLVGLAAECAAKHALDRAGIAIDHKSGFRTHFPRLRTRIMISGQTRHMALLLPIIGPSQYLSGWNIDQRYEPPCADHDTKQRYELWAADVDKLFCLVGIFW